MARYFSIYKPFQVLSQFTSSEGKKTLKDVFDVPANVYAVGRLDYDSEGLLLLTDDAKLNQRLLHPTHKHVREYWVQVEGRVTSEAIHQLQEGVLISIDGKQYNTQPCKVSIFKSDPNVPERCPPIRFRKNIPTSWMSLSLTEGKNRQVRRMTARVGFPTLRLVRYRIEAVTLEALEPGQMKEWTREEMYRALFGKA